MKPLGQLFVAFLITATAPATSSCSQLAGQFWGCQFHGIFGPLIQHCRPNALHVFGATVIILVTPREPCTPQIRNIPQITGALILWFKARSLIKGYWALWIRVSEQCLGPSIRNPNVPKASPVPVRGRGVELLRLRSSCKAVSPVSSVH